MRSRRTPTKVAAATSIAPALSTLEKTAANTELKKSPMKNRSSTTKPHQVDAGEGVGNTEKWVEPRIQSSRTQL